ncbi:hypothetical protein N7455_008961 [Penicillium solitum]|uniref:uncharacterized protein n=1 Tax=Penicillium solitum TaxID=60172 RepID=UPI0032C40E65|nr:hypothetical protein N7455_008961 [Penicillium solitum]
MAPRLPLSKLEMIQDMISSKSLTASQMAKAAGCSKRSIINISNNLRQFGNVRAPTTRVGRRRTVTPPMIEALCDRLLEKPGLYVDEMAIFLWDETSSASRSRIRVSSKRTRSDGAFTPLESSGRVTTREVWKLIDSLKLIIHHQTALIESTKAEIEGVKHDQNVLRDQNEKLHEEIRAMRAQIEALPPAPSSRTWAAVTASGNVARPQQTDSRPDKDLNCVLISTQRSFVDPADNNNSDGNTFGRYLPTDTANNHIRTALMNAPTAQDAQVAGIGTTKTGYVIRFKDTKSAELARNNTEWLNKLGNNTKIVKPRFGIVVYRTLIEHFDLGSTNT